MAAPARICFVLPSLNGGGAERAAVHILNALDSQRWRRSMFLFQREGPYLDHLDPSIELAVASNPSRGARWIELRRFIRASRPQVVVSFLSYFSVLTAVRCAGVGARVVFDQQTPMSAFLTDADYHWRRRWHRRAFSLVTRVGYRLADAVVATSAGVADDLANAFGVARRRIRIVHNPVDRAAIAALSSEPLPAEHEDRWCHPVVVAVGRLANAKNFPLLIDAIAILRRSVPARLFILGDGEAEAALRDRIARLGLDEAVTLVGFQSNPWKYIARGDVFALTSRYEGFGNVLIEAMACGVPIVATGSAGTREILTDGLEGFLVERHEAGAIAAALERILTDQLLHHRLADAARRSAERFALPAVAAEYDRVFAEVLA